MKYLVYFVGLISIISSCLPLECVRPPDKYEFYIPMFVVPKRDTIQVGDSVVMQCIFKNRLYDRLTQDTVVFDKGKFNYSMGIVELLQGDAAVGSNKFERIVKNGKDNATTTSADYNNGIYSLQIIYIAKSSGTFALQASALRNTSQEGSKECDGVGSTTTYFSVSKSKREYFKDLFKIHGLGFELDSFDSIALNTEYLFVVR
jgi:hypothetical protein